MMTKAGNGGCEQTDLAPESKAGRGEERCVSWCDEVARGISNWILRRDPWLWKLADQMRARGDGVKGDGGRDDAGLKCLLGGGLVDETEGRKEREKERKKERNSRPGMMKILYCEEEG